MKYIFSKKAPKAIGPYSQAVVTNGFVFCAGQIGIDPNSNQLVEGIENQTKQIFANLEAVLKAAGSDLGKVTKTTVYLKKMSDFQLMNRIYASYFKNHKPARATIEASSLPKDALIEIEATASM